MLIVFEGTDCSGKSTQINLLLKKLDEKGISYRVLDFPDYSTPTGKIVRRYLDNEFGPANNVPAKIASIFFAEDRFAAKQIVEKSLSEVDVTILDRYVESNMGHQGGKIRNPEERKSFFEWLNELEYGNFNLPKPNAVIFLYMPHQVGLKLKETRIRKSENHPGKEDGHESSIEHLKNAEESYLHLADLYGWIKIDCAPNGTFNSLRTPEDISQEVFKKIEELLNKWKHNDN